MAKKRVHEIAKAQGTTSKELLLGSRLPVSRPRRPCRAIEESDALAALKGSGGRRLGRDCDQDQSAPAAKKTEAAAKAQSGARPRRRPSQRSPVMAHVRRQKGPAKRRRGRDRFTGGPRDPIAKTQRRPARRVDAGRRRRPLLEEPSDRELKAARGAAADQSTRAHRSWVAESPRLSAAEVIRP